MTPDTKIPTRPGVRCKCTRLSVFADARCSRMTNVICICGMNIYRERLDGPILGEDIAGHIRELERVEIKQNGI